MYKSFKLVTFIINVNGGESETVEHLYKEVEGTLVPMTESEAILKMLKNTSTIGENPSIQMLFNSDGNMIKVEEVTKSVTATE